MAWWTVIIRADENTIEFVEVEADDVRYAPGHDLTFHRDYEIVSTFKEGDFIGYFPGRNVRVERIYPDE